MRAYGVSSKLSSEAGEVNITQRNYNAKLAGNTSIDLGNKEYTLTANQFNIAGAPLSFVRSGYATIDVGYLRYASVHGYYWSHSALSTDTRAYDLRISDGDINSSNYYPRLYGFSLRCLQE